MTIKFRDMIKIISGKIRKYMYKKLKKVENLKKKIDRI